MYIVTVIFQVKPAHAAQFMPAMIASEIMLVASIALFVVIVFKATMTKQAAA